MKKPIVLFIFLTIGIVSCTSNTIYKKPKDLIPKDTMAILFKDLYIASVAKNIKNKNDEVRVNYLPLVYEKYRIDSTRFKLSNLFYLSKLEDYKLILQEASELLEKEQGYWTKLQKRKDSIKQDSIKKSQIALKKQDSIKKAQKGQ